jgi:hypothetical protein
LLINQVGIALLAINGDCYIRQWGSSVISWLCCGGVQILNWSVGRVVLGILGIKLGFLLLYRARQPFRYVVPDDQCGQHAITVAHWPVVFPRVIFNHPLAEHGFKPLWTMANDAA